MPHDSDPILGTLGYLSPVFHREPAWRLHDHLQAINDPRDIEIPLVQGLRAWFRYATVYKATFGGAQLDPGVAIPWIEWGDALHQLLNFPTGRLHCGTLSDIIRANQDAERPV